MKRRFALLLATWMAALATATAISPVWSAELLMFTRKSCAYCLLWEKQIGPIYPKTDEAKAAPLRKIDLDADASSGGAFNPPVTITPTFVLVEGTREISRFVGYNDELSFWSNLTEHLKKVPAHAP